MSESGQEGDTRQFRKAKRTDYYAAKSAFEVKPKTKYAKCKVCGQELGEGLNWSGFCVRCHSESG